MTDLWPPQKTGRSVELWRAEAVCPDHILRGWCSRNGSLQAQGKINLFYCMHSSNTQRQSTRTREKKDFNVIFVYLCDIRYTWNIICAKTKKNVQAILRDYPYLWIIFAESYSGVVYYSTITAATTSMAFFLCVNEYSWNLIKYYATMDKSTDGSQCSVA